ncbi:MAG: hypothetical protein N4J56_003332 [Chroococcidiopsis sp. SAG 2025]|nr:hypothetical protein [Chroococcidiopsis sp. SAG 2025]
MFDFNTLAEFFRHYCIGICAFLIPANLVATSLTGIFAVLHRPAAQVWQAAGIAIGSFGMSVAIIFGNSCPPKRTMRTGTRTTKRVKSLTRSVSTLRS